MNIQNEFNKLAHWIYLPDIFDKLRREMEQMTEVGDYVMSEMITDLVPTWEVLRQQWNQ